MDIFVRKLLLTDCNVIMFLFTGVYDQDAAEELLLNRPGLYRQGRLGLVYKPHSFWITMADSLYQSIVIFFLAEGVWYYFIIIYN